MKILLHLSFNCQGNFKQYELSQASRVLYSLQVYNSVPVDLLLSGMSRERIVFEQGTFNCSIVVSGVGGSGDPRRKWEEMGEQEREREKCCFCLQTDLKEP